ncbi:hypothetical protein I553_7855 [Mycobacterium xenopi 4042]|uniref:Uncharacterized protein n=1 Tax=Mycobacterium xenopi 4042 TaxID=1299334 RepID=X8APA7_MYCXE|nr:hypothetical protein I553_7855 [Mycobacterium xenopi 4042]
MMRVAHFGEVEEEGNGAVAAHRGRGPANTAVGTAALPDPSSSGQRDKLYQRSWKLVSPPAPTLADAANAQVHRL